MVKFRTHLRNIFGHCWRIICLANIFKHFRKNPSSTEDERLIDAPNADVIGNNPSGSNQSEMTQETEPRRSSDDVSQPSRSSLELGSSTATMQLREELHAARIESPAESHRFFIPESDKTAIITKDLITKEILATNVGLDYASARSQASLAFEHAKNVFAILAYLGKGAKICELLREGISDDDLPFQRSRHEDRKCNFSLQRNNGGKIEVLEQWDSGELESMGRKQWHLLAPVFEDMEHLKLHKNVTLPFLSLGEEEQEQKTPSGGGYSEVFTHRIHAAHHRFHYHWTADQHPKIAIKRLRDNNEDDFKKEADILTTLGRKANVTPHLVKLLATYEYDGMYHLIFPRANCNLRKYWSNRPEPSFNRKTALWSLQQMAGIAQGLNTIHNFRVTIPLDVENKVRSPQYGVKLSVEKGEELFGRHGDIKPENILWFEHIPGYENDGQGILQITDFGLGRFHGRDSRTEQYPHGVFGSPTYEPPECKLHRPVTRTYDLWSLGCLYLEFATWLLIGFDAIEEFSEKRGRPSSLDSRFSDDYFFTVIRDEGKMPRHAKVREGVVLWARTLHENEKCSKFIHDVVDLVMDDLLRIDARDRIPASWLCVRFGKLLEEAGKDPNYLCTPYRRSPGHPSLHTSRSNSEPVIHTEEVSHDPPKSPKSTKKVSFTESDRPSSPPDEVRPGSPRDLVLRNPGTPGFLALKRKSSTWPASMPNVTG